MDNRNVRDAGSSLRKKKVRTANKVRKMHSQQGMRRRDSQQSMRKRGDGDLEKRLKGDGLRHLLLPCGYLSVGFVPNAFNPD